MRDGMFHVSGSRGFQGYTSQGLSLTGTITRHRGRFPVAWHIFLEEDNLQIDFLLQATHFAPTRLERLSYTFD